MSETMLEELGGMRKQTVKLVRNSHPYIHFYTKSSYISYLQQTTHRLLIQPSHLIENIHLALTNRNRVVKTGAPVYSFIHFNMFLDPAIPDQDAMHLAATRKKNPALCRRCPSPQNGLDLKKSPKVCADVESVGFLNGQASFADSSCSSVWDGTH